MDSTQTESDVDEDITTTELVLDFTNRANGRQWVKTDFIGLGLKFDPEEIIVIRQRLTSNFKESIVRAVSHNGEIAMIIECGRHDGCDVPEHLDEEALVIASFLGGFVVDDDGVTYGLEDPTSDEQSPSLRII